MSKYDAAWVAQADAVASFFHQTGRWPSQTAAQADEKRLGRWLKTQRASGQPGRRGRLTPQRAAYLDEVAPRWRTSNADLAWSASLDALVSFRGAAGSWPGRVSDDEDERRLAWWLQEQRRGKATTPARRALLDETVPGWRAGSRADEQWLKHLGELVTFLAAHGQWPTFASRDAAERSIGDWLAKQRQAARLGLPAMTVERRERLDHHVPGWLEPDGSDGTRRSQGWDRRRDTLAGLVRGDLELTVNLARELGMWLHVQRCRASNDGLAPRRIAQLDEVAPGWRRDGFDVQRPVAVTRPRELEPRWDKTLEEAQLFAVEHGLPRATSLDPTERRLGRWLHEQRRAAVHGSRMFGVKRRAALDERLPGWEGARRADGRERRFHERAAALAAYRRAHGRWPSQAAKDPDVASLGAWLSGQRKRLQDPARLAHLDAVAPGWRSNGRAESWEGRLGELAAFVAARGRLPVAGAKDPTERPLAAWLCVQREASRLGLARMTPQRRARLDDCVPGWSA